MKYLVWKYNIWQPRDAESRNDRFYSKVFQRFQWQENDVFASKQMCWVNR
jgi:hypothetical protein